jgi:CDP-diacylglycerol--serine O-phosphatidyltransferase
VALPPAIFAAVVVGTGVLMVSNIPSGNLKKLRKGNMNRGKGLFLSLFILGLGAIFREKAPLMAMAIYVVSGFFRFDWGGWLSKKEGECPAPGEKP